MRVSDEQLTEILRGVPTGGYGVEVRDALHDLQDSRIRIAELEEALRQVEWWVKEMPEVLR